MGSSREGLAAGLGTAGLVAFAIFVGGGGSPLPGSTTVASTPPGLEGRWVGHWRWEAGGPGLEIVLEFSRGREGWLGSFGADRLRAVDIPLQEVTFVAPSASWRLVGDATTAVFTGSLSGDRIEGTVVEGKRRGTFRLARGETRAPPDEEELTFRSGELTLAGTLLLPARAARPLPAVVFLHGSGPEGRWASKYLARRFTEVGVAALIYDKRGVGASQGDWREAGLEALVEDGVAAVDALRRDPAIDPARVGVHGHSQGGTYAADVAARSRAAFVVASAPSGIPMDELELYSLGNVVGVDRLPVGEASEARELLQAVVATAYHGAPRARLEQVWQKVRSRAWAFPLPPAEDPYWTLARRFATYDPLSAWRRLGVPALVLFGERDERVPARESARRISAAYLGGGGTGLTVEIFPAADHGYRLAPSQEGDWPATVDGYPDQMLAWVSHIVAPARSGRN